MNRRSFRRTVLSVALLAAAIGSIRADGARLYRLDAAEHTARIRNFGSTTVDISSYWFCSMFSYIPLASLPVLEGSLVLGAGDEALLQWSAIDAGPRDFALYEVPNFSDSNAMVDFAEWGSAGNGRESQAVSVGLWTAGEFIPGLPPFQFVGSATQHGADFWTSCASASAGGVPDGAWLAGTPLTVGKGPLDALMLSWGKSCSSCDTDYAIYQGSIGDFTSHAPLACSTDGATTANVESTVESAYYLVVPRNEDVEGSYGTANPGGPRSAGQSVCRPQEVHSCGL